MLNIGGMELLVILVVALLVLGPDKLPKFMRAAGKTLGDLRRASTDFQRAINTELDAGALEDKRPAASLPEKKGAPTVAKRRGPARTRPYSRPRPNAGRKAPPLLPGTGAGTERM